MAKKPKIESVKGGECANTAGCKVAYSDRHNDRDGERNPNSNIRQELTPNNSVWKAAEVKSLAALDRAIRADYAAAVRVIKTKDGKEHIVKRKMPDKGKTAAHPIKETVLLLPSRDKATDAMARAYADRVQQLTGWRPIRIYVHRDERYDNPDTGESTYNNHAHIVWDCYDHQRHEIKKADRDTMRKMQDIAAEVTGMPRGRSATETDAQHLTVAEHKNRAERKRMAAIAERAAAVTRRNTRAMMGNRVLSLLVGREAREELESIGEVKAENARILAENARIVAEGMKVRETAESARESAENARRRAEKREREAREDIERHKAEAVRPWRREVEKLRMDIETARKDGYMQGARQQREAAAEIAEQNRQLKEQVDTLTKQLKVVRGLNTTYEGQIRTLKQGRKKGNVKY